MDFAVVTSFIIPLIIAITMHEAAHGLMAYRLGDDTAKRMGRVTLDPIRHIDPIGTLLLPGLMLLLGSPALFGYAKPVPVDFRNLRKPRRDTILVALAGPGMNIILAFVSALALHLEYFVTPEQAPWTFMNIYNSVTANVVLCVFNLLPILPLDGGRILKELLPYDAARVYGDTERYGMIVVMLLFIIPSLAGHTEIAHYLIGVPVNFLCDVILHAAGIGDGS